jgi:hypothetical protein
MSQQDPAALCLLEGRQFGLLYPAEFQECLAEQEQIECVVERHALDLRQELAGHLFDQLPIQIAGAVGCLPRAATLGACRSRSCHPWSAGLAL